MIAEGNRAFIISDSPEIHQQRRKDILAVHPQVRLLFTYETKTKYLVLILLSLQLSLGYYAQQLNWFWWLMVLYVCGATISHALFAAIHELTHHLAFKSKLANRLFALLTNLPLGIPMAMGFEKYHFIHHRFLGDTEKDVDIPFAKEAAFFNSRCGKLMWLFIQPLMYTLRPFIKWPQKMIAWEWFNIVLQLSFNLAIIVFFSANFLGFLILSSLVAMSLHPTAGHAISEHFIMTHEQETYSYYGPLNHLMFNVGYHVEHHDFPCIPWSKLPELKKIAPEYYDSLYAHASWVQCLTHFIFSKKMNLFSRVVRSESLANGELP